MSSNTSTPTIRVATVGELRANLKRAPEGALFRGQVQHYERPDGSVSLSCSQVRKGCIPPELRKWIFYAKETIRSLGGQEPSSSLIGALMQHYGWRSFFVDFSSDPSVASWFACHVYSELNARENTEDCSGRPLTVLHRASRYDICGGDGNLYIVDPSLLASADQGALDLGTIFPGETATRLDLQAGWLVGPLTAPVVPSSIVARIVAPATVFRDHAQGGGFDEVANLFPPPEKDAFLCVFDAAPWEWQGNLEDGAFCRELRLPDYHWSTRSRFGREYAFPRQNAVVMERGMTCLCPSGMFFAGPNMTDDGLPSVAQLVRREKFLAVQTEGLIRFPEDIGSDEYCGGVFVREAECGLFEIGAIVVKHPGLELEAIVGCSGMYYAVNEAGHFEAREHRNECPCGRAHRHEQLLTVVVALEWLLNNEIPSRCAEKVLDFRGLHSRPAEPEVVRRDSWVE
jgi:hypothetical protein